MIVEDDPAQAAVLEDIVGALPGITVAVAHDAAQARRTLERLRFDLVLLDLWLPGESGAQLCQWARRQPWWSGRVLFLTADTEGYRLLKAARLGDAVLAKPYHVGRLSRAITCLLGAQPA